MKKIKKSVFLVVLLLAVSFSSIYFLTKPSEAGVGIKGNLSAQSRRSVGDFLGKTLKKDFLPQSLEIKNEQSEKISPEEEHWVGAWREGEFFYSVLYVLDKKSKEPKYLRVWVLFPGEKIDKDYSEKLTEELFNENFISSSGNINCREVKSLETGELQTECFFLGQSKDGEKKGITLRAPVTLPSDQKAIFVTGCLIPSQMAPLYKFDFCI